MSIEQTSQLILLILNSVLMTLLSSILLGGAWLRQNALMQQLSKTRSHYRQLTRAVSGSDSLISTALFLFTVGAAGLLVGTGCILIDFAKGNSSHDSLGQTFGRLLKQLNQQWKRRSLQLGVQAAKPLAKGTDTLVGRGE